MIATVDQYGRDGATAMMEARHHAAYYTKGLRGGAGFRRRICQMSHFEELAKLAAEIAKENAE